MFREQCTIHSSNDQLENIVDFVLETHIPVGDGLLNDQGMQYGPASTFIGSTILDALLCQVVEKIADQMW